MQVLVCGHVQLLAHMGAHHVDVLLRLVEQPAYLTPFLALQDEVTHVHFRLGERGEAVCEVEVVHKMTSQMQTHGVDEVALRCRLEHGEQAVGILERRPIVAAHAQIGFYLPLVESDGVHECRFAVVQVSILRLHVINVAAQQFAQYSEEELHAKKETKNLPQSRFFEVSGNASICNQTDGGDDERRISHEAHHKQHYRHERHHLVENDELEEMLGTHVGEIDEAAHDGGLRHEGYH